MDVRFTNTPEFEMSLQQFANKIDANLEDVLRKVSFDLFRGVVQRTPVDTGWARASWNIAFHAPDLSVPEQPSSPGAAKAANSAQEQVLNGPLGKHPVVWITNNLDYIVPLEGGHSKQSGKGFMVQRTLQDVIAELRSTLRSIE